MEHSTDCRLVALEKSIYDPMQNLKLVTFFNLTKRAIAKLRLSDFQFSTQCEKSSKTTLILQSRVLDSKKSTWVDFCGNYLFFSWSYMSDDEMKKIDLLAEFEKYAVLVDQMLESSCSIMDRMASLRKMKFSGVTFFDVAEETFKTAISWSYNFCLKNFYV